jgi:hypothetical protein
VGDVVSDTPEGVDQAHDVDTDLIGYLIVVVPGVDSLSGLTPALAALVRTSTIRLLDAVVVVRELDGTVSVLELEEIEGVSIDGLGELPGGLFTEHDLELASLAIAPGAAGVVLVIEDRWAEPLSAAAQRIGGRIIAGERIPARRVEAALVARAEEEGRGG